MMADLVGFTVPEWILEKMKIQMAAMRTDQPKLAKKPGSGTGNNLVSLDPRP